MLSIKHLIRKTGVMPKFLRYLIMRENAKKVAKPKIPGALIAKIELGKVGYYEVINYLTRNNLYKDLSIFRASYSDYVSRSVFESDAKTFEKAAFCHYAYGFEADEFFLFGLRDKSIIEIKKYISDRDLKVASQLLNDVIDKGILQNKEISYSLLSDLYGRNAVYLSNPKDYEAFCKFIDQHHVFVMKEANSMRGECVKRIDACSIRDTKTFFDSEISGHRILLEELIKQSSFMSQFNMTSVNTVRVAVFNGFEDWSDVFCCVLKTGRNGSFVDNGARGGILSCVDAKTGIVKTHGRDENGVSYEKHPDSGKQFLGTQLPDWEDLQEKVTILSNRLPSLGYIGWDFAHTEFGWVVVEGNSVGQFLSQFSSANPDKERAIRALNHSTSKFAKELKEYFANQISD